MSSETLLKKGERLDDLMRSGLQIIQSRSVYSFGLDSVLLAHFARAGRRDVVVELGAGNGVVMLLMSALTPAPKILGIEIQPELASMARRSIEINGLGERVRLIEGNLLDAPESIGNACADVVVTNPPYLKGGSGRQNPNESLAIARHEIHCTLEDVIRVSETVLKRRGRLYMVHRSDRVTDVLCSMRSSGIEPKRMLMVHPRCGTAPKLFLVEGIKGAKPGVAFCDPLYVYDEDGEFSAAIRGIYSEG